jgi:hypothetical protein
MTPKNWLVALALTGGVLGGGAIAMTTTRGPEQAQAVAAPAATANPNTAALRREIRGLLIEERDLRHTLTKVRHRLHDRVRSAEAALTTQRQQLAAQEAAVRQQLLAAEQAAAAASRQPASAPASHSQPTTPPTHGTTGASGATGGHHGDDGGGHDD